MDRQREHLAAARSAIGSEPRRYPRSDRPLKPELALKILAHTASRMLQRSGVSSSATETMPELRGEA